jgi:hypothetical protein
MTAPYRVLVTGSRDFTDYTTVCLELGDVMVRLIAAAERHAGDPYPQVVVVHGTARGADELAERAACALGMKTERHPADWSKGRSAGYERNAAMVKLGADVCLAFYQTGSGNRGTDHCARTAEHAGIPVKRISNADAVVPSPGPRNQP